METSDISRIRTSQTTLAIGRSSHKKDRRVQPEPREQQEPLARSVRKEFKEIPEQPVRQARLEQLARLVHKDRLVSPARRDQPEPQVRRVLLVRRDQSVSLER